MNATFQQGDGSSIGPFDNGTNAMIMGEGSGSDDVSSLPQAPPYADSDMFWMLVWVASLILFILAPFCISERRRTLCLRRILERRWISFDEMEEDDWYRSMIENRRQQERRQVAAEQAATLSKEDAIRTKYLNIHMERYTMVRMPIDVLEVCKQGSEDSVGKFYLVRGLSSNRC